MDLKLALREIAEAALPDDQHFIVDLRLSDQKAAKVTILVDGDEGISIDDCAKMSRSIGAVIEERDLIDNKFILEVSSPGVSEPLVMPRQYNQHVGRELEITNQDQQVKYGTLLEVQEDSVLIEEEMSEKGKKKKIYQETRVPFQDIAKAMVQVSFKKGKK